MKRLLTAIALAAAALSCAAQTPPGVVLSFTPSTTGPIAIGEQITVRATMTPTPLIKEFEFLVRVKEL